MSNEMQLSYDVGSETVQLSPQVVRSYLVSGDGNPSDQEIVFFMKMCKARNINPWLKEAYLIKYSNNSPAALVVGKDYFLRKAQQNEAYEGHTVEISKDGDEATATVHVKGLKVPVVCTVYLEECIGRKNDGTVNAQWTKRPRWMLKKCALAAALREAFTSDFGNMYMDEEISPEMREVEIVQEPEELTPQPETSEIPKQGKKANEQDDGWVKSISSFCETLGNSTVTEVLKEMGFENSQKVPPNKRSKVFQALSKKASECL